MKYMASNSVKPTETVLDPTFFIPEGVSEFVYSDSTPSQATDQEVDTSISDEGPGDDVYLTDDSDARDEIVLLDAPDELTVVSQTVRTGPGGQQVIDIVCEIADVPGASNYEVHITKT